MRPKMADGRHLEKSQKSQYFHNRLTDVDEIWHGDAPGPSAGDQPLNFQDSRRPPF